ncbi:unnamed protein product [Parnassius apollo]|uniref:(apollo) hypothetical protein n=1 Tax=Parnassius apollo TaxID=110799 RepID=A0A8S3WPP1_PARAO|nr:unnamed protein product [Parnassius apollo]
MMKIPQLFVLRDRVRVAFRPKGQQYDCALYLLFVNDCNDILIFKTTSEHNHDQIGTRAFVEKWQTQTEFIHYFKEEWLKKHPNWFLGAAPRSPATNNALEAFNRNIKDQNTLRERLPLSHFLTIATEMVAQWSLQSCREPLPETPTIELKDWTVGYCWARKDLRIKILSSNTAYGNTA